MEWSRFALTVLVAGIGASLTDWFFGGVLWHDKYMAYPEVWRDPPGTPETKKILLSTALGFVTCAAFAFVCARLGLVALLPALKLAAAVWVIGPLPLIVTNALWMKMHPATAVAHSLGWLAKLAVTALAVAWLRP
jgi:hypothetical protein